jgi:hypothetical protein
MLRCPNPQRCRVGSQCVDAGSKQTHYQESSQSRNYAPELTVELGWWDNPTMILTLDSKRRLTLPASLVPAQPGDHFEAEFDPEEDAVVFRRITKNSNWLTVLKGCPVKMDSLPSRSREYPKRLKL